MVEYDGRKYYASCYAVHDLQDSLWVTENARHALFIAKVGDDCRKQHPQSQWHEYYDTLPSDFEAEYRTYPITGYFKD